MLSVCFLAVRVNDAAAEPTVTPPADVVKDVVKYLDGIDSLQARFTQEDDSGLPASGTFYMQRPAKIRWDYDPPSHLLIILNGSVMALVDRELDEVRNVPLDGGLAALPATPAKSLFDASGDVILKDYYESDAAYYFTFAQKEDASHGALTLKFAKPEVELLGFSQIDQTGRRVNILFNDKQYNLSIPRKQFLLPKGRARGNRR